MYINVQQFVMLEIYLGAGAIKKFPKHVNDPISISYID
jgi:hypothetical protein